MKKLFTIVSLLLLCAMCAACGSSKDTTQEKDDTPISTFDVGDLIPTTTTQDEVTPPEPEPEPEPEPVPEPVPEPDLSADELYNLGNEAYDNDESRTAFNYYTQASELGDIRAICLLAHCYEKGVGTSVDMDTAISLYEYSAANGCEHAQLCLARCYTVSGYNDLDQFEYWLLQLADNGSNKDLISYANSGLDIVYRTYTGYGTSRSIDLEVWYVLTRSTVDFSNATNRP